MTERTILNLLKGNKGFIFSLSKFIPKMLDIFCIFFRNDFPVFVIVVFGVVFFEVLFVFMWKLQLRNANFVGNYLPITLQVFKLSYKINFLIKNV